MLVLGVGFESGADAGELIALATSVLDGQKPDVIATLAHKIGAPQLAALALHFSAPVQYFSAARLELETPRLKNPSERVFRAVGCHGVAEAAALASAGHLAWLRVEKTRSEYATVAVAEFK